MAGWSGIPAVHCCAMVKTLAIPNGGHLVLDWEIEGVPMKNVIGIMGTQSINVNQALADSIDSMVKAQYASSGLQALQTSQVILRSITIRSLDQANLAPFTGEGGSAAGTLPSAGADMLPLATAYVITFRTAKAGREFRGRTSLPGFNESNNDAIADIAADAASAALIFVGNIRNNLPSGLRFAINSRWLPVRLNHKGEELPERQPFVTEVISVTSRSTRWSTQRRRSQRH